MSGTTPKGTTPEGMKEQGCPIPKYQHNYAECGVDFNLNTGENIPAIGLGTWQIDPAEISDVLPKAIELGYRHFDCASKFGNQKQIGDILNKYIHTKGFGRSNFFVTSKLWGTHHKKQHVKTELERTLRELQLHHLDLFLMHCPSQETENKGGEKVPLEETWRAMEALVKEGRTRAIGVSNFTLEQLRQLDGFAKIRPAVAEFEVHPYLIQSDIIEFCNRHGIVVVCQSPLGSVTGKEELLNDSTLKQLAEKYNKTPCQLILRWNIQNHRCVIPKCRELTHLQENLQIFNFEISIEDLNQIDSLQRGKQYIQPEKTVPKFEGEGRKSRQEVGAR